MTDLEGCERIERARDQLDRAINIAPRDCRVLLLDLDMVMKTLKKDLGYPTAGLLRGHGISCQKKPHRATGYLHGEDDDSPYDVDGVQYCGRCHVAL